MKSTRLPERQHVSRNRAPGTVPELPADTDAVAALAHQHSLDADDQRETAIDSAWQAMVAVHAAGDVAAAHAAQDLMNILRKGRSRRASWLSILKSRNLR